jgi:sucrose-6-phosphate hydrolase SacC (GH32 family)
MEVLSKLNATPVLLAFSLVWGLTMSQVAAEPMHTPTKMPMAKAESVGMSAEGSSKEPPVGKGFRFVPSRRQVGDTMPFYWNGEYHVYYLMNPTGNYQINWEHIVSKDLVNWRELPPALRYEPDDPAGPDGVCIFTGDVEEKDGVFHAWYTSWNPRNRAGREFISHATSRDLIHWTKHREHMIGPDGIHYANHRERDFRDPEIIWNEEKEEYSMYVFANVPNEEGGRFGLLTSKDLIKWEQELPIEGVPGGETPSHLKIGDTYYIISNDYGYSHADSIEGPFKRAKLPNGIVVEELDGLQTAAKTLWDGKRYVWFGGWCGRSMPIPHEIYAGPGGLLYVKPVEEMVAVFDETALDLAKEPLETVIDVPLAYMLECRVMLSPTSRFTVSFGETVHFSLVANNDPNNGKLSLAGSETDVTRPCPVATSLPTKVQAFVDETLIEFFVNDQFVQTCIPNKWWPMEATLKFSSEGGKVDVLHSEVRIRR